MNEITQAHNGLTTDLAVEIRKEHAAAIQHADKAVEHAKRAGELLLQAKGELPHGGFLPWIDEHLDVSRRQAQRYMRAAQGKPMTARQIKNDTVSHLPDNDGSNWLPEDDSFGLMLELQPYRGWVDGDDGPERGWVNPVLHVQMCPNDAPHYDVMLLDNERISYTRRPITHWGALYMLVLTAAGRQLKEGGMFPVFDPFENDDGIAKGHARMAELPWQKFTARGFVRSMINIKLENEGQMKWPMESRA